MAQPCRCCKMRCWYDVAQAAKMELGHVPGEAGEQEVLATLKVIRACMISECTYVCSVSAMVSNILKNRTSRFDLLWKQKAGDVLLNVPYPVLFSFTCFPPLIALFVCVGIGLTVDVPAIVNYNWKCGRVFLPAVSRIINLPKERPIWQLLIWFHAPFRIMVVWSNYILNTKPSRSQYPRIRKFFCVSLFLAGSLEVIFLVTLSVIGERENGPLHAILFYAFATVAWYYFVLNTTLFRQSEAYRLQTNGKQSYLHKLLFLIFYSVALPFTLLFFILYWQACITWAYTAFALLEYVGVAANCGFHCSTYLDYSRRYVTTVQ
uniref:Post-GPI attachment to proteins factor 2 n=2 Tax=Plectus sambesii TaxID=2011161 RepID=A0A914X7V4_9BILA